MMCDHCLAPDTSSGAGIGCDNMTVLIVAILNGRTKEEWYSWITDRVMANYGYETPSILPQIYATSRLMAYKARREAQEERNRARAEREESNNNSLLGAGSAFGGFARVLGSTGGMSFNHSSVMNNDLMFGTSGDDDSDEDEMSDEMDTEEGGSRSLFSSALGISSSDITSNLKAKLDEFENEFDLDLEKGGESFGMDGIHDGQPGPLDSKGQRN